MRIAMLCMTFYPNMTIADTILKGMKDDVSAQISFRMPPMIREAMDLWRKHNPNYPFKDMSDLYRYLTHSRLVHHYSTIFKNVRDGEAPVPDSLGYDYLSSFGVDTKTFYWKVIQGKKVSQTITMPQMVLDFVNYMIVALGSDKSPHFMYYALTEKILISELQPQLEHLLFIQQEERAQKQKTAEQQQNKIFT